MRQGWEYKKLGEICDVRDGTHDSPKYVLHSDYVLITSKNVINGAISYDEVNYITEKDYNAINQRSRVDDGDIIMPMIGTIGNPVIVKLDSKHKFCIKNVALIKFQKDGELNNSFLLHYLKSSVFKDYIESQHRGGTQKFLALGAIRNLSIQLPPQSTQQAIVSELDKINELIRLKKEQLKDYDNLAQSIFYEMFGDPGENEKGWKVRKYGEVFNIGSGGTPSKSKSEYWENGNIPWIGSNMCQNCVITATDGKFITEEGLSHSSAKMLYPGTVLVALVGATIGKVALLKTETTTNQNIAFIKVSESKDFLPEYVYFHLMNQYHEFMNIGNGDFKMASQGFIKGLNIIKAPLSLQQTFASRIEAIERQKAEVQKSITELETLLASRMQYWFE